MRDEEQRGYALSLSQLDLPASTVRALADHGIATLDQLRRLDEASLARMGIGRREAHLIRRALQAYQGPECAAEVPRALTLVDVWDLDRTLLSDNAPIQALKLDTRTRKALAAFGVASIESLVRLSLDGLRQIQGISPASLEVIRTALVKRCRPRESTLALPDAPMGDASGAAMKPAERSHSLSTTQVEERGEAWRSKLADWLASPAGRVPAAKAQAFEKESQRTTPVATGDKVGSTAMRPSPESTPLELPRRADKGADGARGRAVDMPQHASRSPDEGAPVRSVHRMPGRVSDSLEVLVASWLRRLDERTRLAAQLYYGLDGPAETGTRIAKRLGVTPARVYQLLGDAVARLARLQRTTGTELYLDSLKHFLRDKGGLASEAEVRRDLGGYVALGEMDPVAACRILAAMDSGVVWLRRLGLLADASNPTERIEAIREGVRACVKGEDPPPSLNRILFLFCGSRRWSEECGRPTEDFVVACLRTDPGVEVDEAGRVRWKEQRRAGVADLLAEVLSEQGQPAHYSLLAERVNERVSIDERVSERTVYAALRRDARFVAVGRGVFSLVE